MRSAPYGLEDMTADVETGAVDTVVVAMVDMQGRLVGKRVTGEYFLSHHARGIDCCNSLLTLDMESDTTPGYAMAGIELGYGDLLLRPDLSTLRRIPWHEATALVLCDPYWFDGSPVVASPKHVLANQVERARSLGFEPKAASEVEFFVCRETYDAAHRADYASLTLTQRYVTDAHLLAPGFDEPLIGHLRRSMSAASIPVETSKAEAWAGQHEITFGYGDPVALAGHHAVYKHGAKELADQAGCSITFMAKPFHEWIGSSCHVHMSLWQDGRNAFTGETALCRHFLAGQLACIAELAVFVAPNVNSYKRFGAGATWAGDTLTWAHDNRTTGFRVVGREESFRVECRIPGADCNPYLAFAALLAAGLQGVEHELELPPPYEGNAYASDAERFPPTLRAAVARVERGTVARAAFGDEVVDHYLNAARAEQRLFDGVVTDYERARMFERG
jgi:glutamine synthetase